MVGHRLAVPSIRGIASIEIPRLVRLEADGAYTRIHCAKGKRLMASHSLGYYEELLSRHGFHRCHHGHMVNLALVTEVSALGGYRVRMANGDVVEVSRRKWSGLLRAMHDLQ